MKKHSAKRVNPSAPPSDWQQAVAHHQAGRLDEAARCYERVLARDPRHSEALQLLGLITLNQRNPARAVELIRRSIELNPKSLAAHANLGASYRTLGQRELALACYESAVSLSPDYAEGWVQTGNLLGELGQVRESLARYDKALAIEPNHPGALNNRGTSLRRLGQPEQALACFDAILAREPQRHDARLNRGAVLLELGRDAAALTEFDTVVAAQPEHGLAWSNRGFALMRLGRDDEAVLAVERATTLAPQYPPAWVNRGTVMLALARYAEARAAFNRALELVPTLAEARFNLANVDLVERHFSDGWQGFEARWSSRHHESRRHTDVPVWHGGAPLDGKRVLLWHEQGLGDTLQFCRYSRDITARGATAVLEVQPALKRLLAQSLPGVEVIATGEPAGACDLAVPLMSLPLALRVPIATQQPEPAYLHPDPALVAEWAARLGARSTRLRVGLAISGNAAHRNDTNRSIALSAFAPVLNLVDGVILQKGLRDEDARALAQYPGTRYVGDAITDFSDTAAAIAQCDLVICADTSVAHLAGALGKPVWVLLPSNPDWRWQLERNDSPWYASATLFRQAKKGDWSSVLVRVAHALQTFAAHRRSASSSESV